MVEHHPVHNSEVYLLGLAPRPTEPPPSPPSPLTPLASDPVDTSSAIEQLCLDEVEGSQRVIESSRPLLGQRISGAVHVLNTEATALRALTTLYKTNPIAAEGFDAAVETITSHCHRQGKLVIIGVGKSGHIGKKLVATFNSLGLQATFLHPTEALHGDLGCIGKHDVVFFITFSGKTQELLTLLPHVDAVLPVIVLTSHAEPADCEIIRRRPRAILLPAPIHEAEKVSFGVSAPTTSTTVALALGDALAVVASQELHASVSSVFARNHPGGAIGAAFRKPVKIREVAVPLREIPVCAKPPGETSNADILKFGFDSPSGWVRVGDALASPQRIRRLDTSQLSCLASETAELLVGKSEWVNISSEAPIAQVVQWIRNSAVCLGPSDDSCGDASILAVMENGEVVGVLEAAQILE
ncbi:SIS domain-containing protein [Xylariomycetidae sp. FL0641]|nr:SIS domain-containing protein [Xylariomycetidae sp. FL0641]